MRADVNGLSSSIIFCVSLLSFNFCFLMFWFTILPSEECDHWTHLRYCSPVNVVCSKSVFRCPHCDSKWTRKPKHNLIIEN
jgi:hypothetical protein